MGGFQKVLIGTALVLAAASGAEAADFIDVGVQSSPIAVPVSDSFDWSGFYTGVYGVAQTSPGADTELGIGLSAGINAQFDFVLVGGEVALQGLTSDTLDTTYGQVLGRAGVILTDDTLLYASAGYGVDLGPRTEEHLLLGGGVELAVTESVSLRAQYLHGFSLAGDGETDQVTLGASFHF